ncbi:uncharacterized protein LOC119704136 [Motacilla alba alba]|uniref:uncharacterized protein LOC119704136 n=1 Tax=Motacilla alba alba TaxID=1094192 RepID=UPI0018D4FF34|nr:uncharacterized protein LOC119704136 [Motacilla alba alba]
MRRSRCVPPLRTPGQATAGDLPGSHGHSSPPRRIRGGVGARSELSTLRGIPARPPRCLAPIRAAFPGADFLPLRGVSLPWRRCDQSRAARGPCPLSARFVPSCPASLPPPRQEGRKHRAWSGRAASSAWCDQHPRAAEQAAPGRPRRASPLRTGVAPGSGQPGCATGRGLVPSRVRRRKEWEVGKGTE